MTNIGPKFKHNQKMDEIYTLMKDMDLARENLELKDKIKIQEDELRRVRAELGRLKDTFSQVSALKDILARIEANHQRN